MPRYDYEQNSFRQGDAGQLPQIDAPSGLRKFLEMVRVGYRSGDGGGFGFNGDWLKQQREESDAEKAKKIKEIADARQADFERQQKNQEQIQKIRIEAQKDMAIRNALQTAEDITTGKLAHGMPLIGAPMQAAALPNQQEVNPAGLPSGPMELNQQGAASVTMAQELAMRPGFTPAGQIESINQAQAATEKLFKPDTPAKQSRSDIKDYYQLQWNDLVDMMQGDEDKAWESLPADARRQVKLFNIFDPGQKTRKLESDLSAEVRKERAKRANEYEKMSPFQREQLGMTKQQYVQSVTVDSVLLDPINEEQYKPIWSKFGITEENLDQMRTLLPVYLEIPKDLKKTQSAQTEGQPAESQPGVAAEQEVSAEQEAALVAREKQVDAIIAELYRKLGLGK